MSIATVEISVSIDITALSEYDALRKIEQALDDERGAVLDRLRTVLRAGEVGRQSGSSFNLTSTVSR